MKLEEAMTRLESMGTEQNRKIYRRHGAGENQFGVSFANLRLLKKEIKADSELARALWRTGNADARNLATLVLKPGDFDQEEIDEWIEGVTYYLHADQVVKYLAGPHRETRRIGERWLDSPREYVAQAGWDVIATLAMTDKSLADSYFEALLARIEREITSAPNRARHAMNNAVIAIGLRNESLREKAVTAAGRLGKVAVDHGETGCVTPDAASYIARSWARKKGAA